VKDPSIDNDFERTNAYERIEAARDFVNNELQDVTDGTLKFVMSNCFMKSYRDTKHWLKSPQLFKSYFKKTTLKICDELEKKIKSMMRIGATLEEKMYGKNYKKFIGIVHGPYRRKTKEQDDFE